MTPPDGAQTLRVLEHFGTIKLDHFDDRLRLQKLAFLIQEIGERSDFVYYWYVRGPYSPALTQALFSREGATYKNRPGISGGELDLADKVKSLVGDKINDPLTLELYASVWYLAPKRRLVRGDRASIMRTMRQTKPHFSEEKVANTLTKIEAFRRDNRLSR